jgi:5-methylcytosine-specific restriction endonuclease McrA
LDQIRAFVQSHQGKTITSSNPIVFGQFQTLLAQHPTWANKLDTIEKIHIGVGFNKTATVMKIKTQNSKRFITSSWRKCKIVKRHKRVTESAVPLSTDFISPQEVSLFGAIIPAPILTGDKLTGAMRNSIRFQIKHWKETHRLNRQCCQCKSLLRLHADHVFPFTLIKQDFLNQCKEINLSLPVVFRFNRRTCQPMFTAQDRAFATRWNQYHLKHAQLQWLCSTCNLKKGKKV